MVREFIDLPAEIRELIYSEVLSSANSKRQPIGDDEPAYYVYHLDILRANRQIYWEAIKIFQDNVFVKITTPWPQSIDHINSEGKVPLVARGQKAHKFKGQHLWVWVDTADSPWTPEQATVSMITTLEDLPSFTQMWRYSDLNHQQGLNPHLKLHLKMRDPHIFLQKIPQALQEALLFPFGLVHNLKSFHVDHYNLLPSVSSHLATLRAIPEPSVEECLDSCTALKDLGNKHLTAGQYHLALCTYNRAFAAIHIIVSGRHRAIHADGFFVRDLRSGPHTGQRGDYIRMILRIKLVANIVLCYLRLRLPDEAYFWGRRTIVLFRQNFTGDTSDELDGGSEEVSWTMASQLPVRFPAQAEMGKMLYRTALAAREIKKAASEVRMLILAAAKYLPNDETVQKEMRALAGEGQ